MKFLVDAQLPRQLADFLSEEGHDVLHTLDLPEGNRTSDNRINEISGSDERAVITKDADFVNSFLISKRPYKLLLISTGNISNRELKSLFSKNLPVIVSALSDYNYVELAKTSLIEHG